MALQVERKLTADEIVAQLFVFLLAGFDTTANSLSYLSYCFAKNPEAMHFAQQEIDDVCTEEVSEDKILANIEKS